MTAPVLAGVEIREVADLAEFAAVQQLFDGIWRPDPRNPPVTTEMLRALTKAGNYVAAAYNAYFNLVKLGAIAAEYLPDFYGGMHDGINGDDETDRLLVRWDLDALATPVTQTQGGARVTGFDRAGWYVLRREDR